MSYIFHKNKIIIMTFSMVGILLLLLITAYDINNKTEKPVDFLSKDYIYLSIYSLEESNLSERDFINRLLALENKNFLVGKMLNVDKGCAIYYANDYNLPISIVKGRSFNDKDFMHRKDVAIVNVSYKDIIRKKNIEYISYNDQLFQIVGRYRDENLANSKQWYINMKAQSLKISNDGDYFFQSSNEKLKEKIDSYCSDLKKKYEYNYNITYGKAAEIKFTNFDVMIRFF